VRTVNSAPTMTNSTTALPDSSVNLLRHPTVLDLDSV
jgi:hypothetical protein